MESKKKNNVLILAIIIFVVLLLVDQISKQVIISNKINTTIIPDILQIRTVENRGGAFGIGQGNTSMFIITNIVVLGLIIRFIYLQRDNMDAKVLNVLFLILAGGFGNLIDRIFRGFVVDFINFIPITNFPKFNFADIYITIGWICLAFVFAMYTYREIQNNKQKE